MNLKIVLNRIILNSNFTIVICFVFVLGTVLSGCGQPEIATEESQEESSNKVTIIAKPGETILPVFNDTLQFIGLPCYLGAKEVKENPEVYLIFGEGFSVRKKLDIVPIATMNYTFKKQPRKMHISIPLQEEYQNWAVAEGENFNIEYGFLKLWVQDWLVYSYSDDQFEFVDWQIYRE